MIYKIEIEDRYDVFDIFFPNSDYPNLARNDGDIFLHDGYISYTATTTRAAVSTRTAIIYVYDIYDNLIHTLTLSNGVVNTNPAIAITATSLVIAQGGIEKTTFNETTTTITYSNLIDGLEFNNTRAKDFSYSIDGVNYFYDKIPSSITGVAGTGTTLYIRRNKNSFGNLNFNVICTSGSINDTVEIATNTTSDSLDTWHDASSLFVNSWVNYGSSFQELEYTKDNNNIVHIRGVVKSGTALTIFTLPTIYRPTVKNEYVSVDNVGLATITIDTDGTVDVDNASKNTKLSVNISYKI